MRLWICSVSLHRDVEIIEFEFFCSLLFKMIFGTQKDDNLEKIIL